MDLERNSSYLYHYVSEVMVRGTAPSVGCQPSSEFETAPFIPLILTFSVHHEVTRRPRRLILTP